MFEGTAKIGETDMPEKMQEHAMRCALDALDLHEISDCKEIACYVKTGPVLAQALLTYLDASSTSVWDHLPSCSSEELHKNLKALLLQIEKPTVHEFFNSVSGGEKI